MPAGAHRPPRSAAEYDQYLYSNFPYAETHPDRLATLAMLLGLSPAPPERCRVLELGCGLGGNLIGMAAAYPQARFVGIDQSPRQAEIGQACARALGLQNIELIATDIRDFHDQAPFDYLICHGVYSWVPDEVQRRILQIARTCLAPTGIAYISYNTLPGWHMRGMLRDLLRRHVGDEGAVPERIRRARAFLAFLGQSERARGTAHAYLHGELQIVGQLGDEYLYYEHLVGRNQPQYFLDFARAAEGAGLCYLTDAQFGATLPARPDLVRASFGDAADDPLLLEQAQDLLDLRLFRRSLLCQREAAPAIDRHLTWTRLRPFVISCPLSKAPEAPDLRPGVAVDFSSASGGVISTDAPLLKAALHLLHRHRPRGLPFDELCAAAAQLLAKSERQQRRLRVKLGEGLLELFSLGYLELSLGTVAYVTTPGRRPCTTALCRLQVGEDGAFDQGGGSCTNLRHESVAVDDLDRSLLRRMDGRLTEAGLLKGVLADLAAGVFSIEKDDRPLSGSRDLPLIRSLVRQRLERLARSALLVA